MQNGGFALCLTVGTCCKADFGEPVRQGHPGVRSCPLGLSCEARIPAFTGRQAPLIAALNPL